MVIAGILWGFFWKIISEQNGERMSSVGFFGDRHLSGCLMAGSKCPDLEAGGHTYNLGRIFCWKCVTEGVGFKVSYTQDAAQCVSFAQDVVV